MTVLLAPPIDHSPRLASVLVDDFDVPTGREEEWRFAPVTELAAFMDVDPAAGAFSAAATAFVADVDASSIPETDWLPTDRPSAVARAGVRSAITVTVPDDVIVDEPIVVTLTGSQALSYGYVDVRIGRNASATVVVVHDASVDASGALVTELADGARLTMLSIIDGPAEKTHLWHWHAAVGRDASFVGAVITLGGRIVRICPSVSYRGPGGTAELLGAFLAAGHQYLEHRMFVEHQAPHCTSTVVYKGALSGEGAHTVWIGDVLVRPSAVGTSTYEMNRNLLLDDGPRADSVPNLELETGDIVSAGHASATGRFDDEQLFYLQSRGIPERIARQLVVRGFFVDVLARVPSAEWREATMARIANRLGMDDLDRAGEGVDE